MVINKVKQANYTILTSFAHVWSKTSFTLWKLYVAGEGGTYSESKGWGAVTHDGNSWRRKQQENKNREWATRTIIANIQNKTTWWKSTTTSAETNSRWRCLTASLQWEEQVEMRQWGGRWDSGRGGVLSSPLLSSPTRGLFLAGIPGDRAARLSPACTSMAQCDDAASSSYYSSSSHQLTRLFFAEINTEDKNLFPSLHPCNSLRWDSGALARRRQQVLQLPAQKKQKQQNGIWPWIPTSQGEGGGACVSTPASAEMMLCDTIWVEKICTHVAWIFL